MKSIDLFWFFHRHSFIVRKRLRWLRNTFQIIQWERYATPDFWGSSIQKHAEEILGLERVECLLRFVGPAVWERNVFFDPLRWDNRLRNAELVWQLVWQACAACVSGSSAGSWFRRTLPSCRDFPRREAAGEQSWAMNCTHFYDVIRNWVSYWMLRMSRCHPCSIADARNCPRWRSSLAGREPLELDWLVQVGAGAQCRWFIGMMLRRSWRRSVANRVIKKLLSTRIGTFEEFKNIIWCFQMKSYFSRSDRLSPIEQPADLSHALFSVCPDDGATVFKIIAGKIQHLEWL